MKVAASIVAGLIVACSLSVSHAQVPAIIGTWKLNAAASKFPEPVPQAHVRSYRLGEDGVLVGVAVIVDDKGRPSFLQFAAKPDGKDYPEFDTQSAARYLSAGALPPRTYAEIVSRDPRKVKWVSVDGKTLSFTVDARNERGEAIQYLYVFDRTGP